MDFQSTRNEAIMFLSNDESGGSFESRSCDRGARSTKGARLLKYYQVVGLGSPQVLQVSEDIDLHAESSKVVVLIDHD